jgi:excisionase family DNA binding protein
MSDVDHDTVTVDEASQILRISRSTVLNLIWTKKLHAVKPASRRWLIPKKSLEKFLEERS